MRRVAVAVAVERAERFLAGAAKVKVALALVEAPEELALAEAQVCERRRLAERAGRAASGHSRRHVG